MKLSFRHYKEAFWVWSLLGLSRAMPLDVASWIGDKLTRLVGPTFKAHKTGQKNLQRFMPHLNEVERKKLLSDMWGHMGRIGAELAHLPGTGLTSRVEITGMENVPRDGQPVIFISGHLGQWELSYPIAFDNGIPVTLVYRHANNPYVDRLLCRQRASHATDMFPKGLKGSAKLVRTLKSKNSLAMLVDQKMNDGIAVPFFGVDAMTAPAVAQFALRFGLPIIPARVIRTKGAHFKGEILPPMQFNLTGDEEKDVYTIMCDINALLEKWIRETPEQWLWVHKRWPD